jgi:hypothetical protein
MSIRIEHKRLKIGRPEPPLPGTGMEIERRLALSVALARLERR